MVKIIFFISVFLIFFGSCGNSVQKVTNVNVLDSLPTVAIPSKAFVPGSITENSVCATNSQFSYALFLPSKYTAKEKWPLLILFDPHAEALIPLKKYQSIADSAGYILACSYQSKNGVNPSIYSLIKNAILDDIQTNLSINEKRIYLGGFSGGGRVAINLGLSKSSIAGILSNSAGFEPSRAPLSNGLVFFGITGNEDFNWCEQMKTETSLNNYSFPHYLYEFNGKHTWAPAETMNMAFLFFDCAAKRNNLNVKNEVRLQIAYDNEIKKISGLKNNSFEFFNQTQLLVRFFKGVFETEKFEIELEKQKVNKSTIAEIEKLNAAIIEEGKLQNEFFQKVFMNDVAWWEQEVKKMNSNKADLKKYRLNQRILSYLSLAVYMTINSPEVQQDMFSYEKLIRIYELVDPENSEWSYLKAVLLAKQNNKNKCLEYLQTAKKLGFSDSMRFLNQSEFKEFLIDENFKKVISK